MTATIDVVISEKSKLEFSRCDLSGIAVSRMSTMRMRPFCRTSGGHRNRLPPGGSRVYSAQRGQIDRPDRTRRSGMRHQKFAITAIAAALSVAFAIAPADARHRKHAGAWTLGVLPAGDGYVYGPHY